MKCYICGKSVTLLGDGDLAVLNLVRYRGAVDSRLRGNDSFGFVPHIFKKRYNRTYALTLLVGCGSVRQSTNPLYMESLRKSCKYYKDSGSDCSQRRLMGDRP